MKFKLSRKDLAPGFLLGLVVIFAVVWASGSRATPAAAPPIDWQPKSLSTTAVAGQESIHVVSFVAGQDLEDLVVRVAPEIAGFVTVSPAAIGDLSRGERVDLLVTVAPPISWDPQTLSGTIQIRKAMKPRRNYARPLPVEVAVVWPSADVPGFGLSFSYPPDLVLEVFPPSDTGQFVSLKASGGQAALTLAWREGYPAGVPLSSWADTQDWPDASGDWRAILELESIAGLEVLRSPDTGSVVFALGSRVYFLHNGIGLDPVYFDPQVIEDIVKSIRYGEE